MRDTLPIGSIWGVVLPSLLLGRRSRGLSAWRGELTVAEMTSKPIVAGIPAPDFELPSLTGSPVRLSDYRGRKVVLFMWASW